MHLWHDISPGPQPPDLIHALVEIPKGSRNKYEVDKPQGFIRLDRVLYSSLHYPSDYGIMPQTLYDDGDPLDVLVLVTEPTFPGCVIEARPIGVFRMQDRGDPDDKFLAVPAKDPLFSSYQDLDDLPPHFLKEVQHFFAVYKDLEGVRVKTLGWDGADVAKKDIVRSMKLYDKKVRPTLKKRK